MSATLYWPEDYADESMPQGRATPDAWLETTPGGGFQLAKADWFGPVAIKPGETATFIWRVDYGAIPVLVRADGGFEIEGEPHPDATQFSCPPHVDTMEYSLADFARGFAEKYLAPQGAKEERVMVDMGTWCEAVYRLVRIGDAARFELVTAHSGGNA